MAMLMCRLRRLPAMKHMKLNPVLQMQLLALSEEVAAGRALQSRIDMLKLLTEPHAVGQLADACGESSPVADNLMPLVQIQMIPQGASKTPFGVQLSTRAGRPRWHRASNGLVGKPPQTRTASDCVTHTQASQAAG